jgi:hypothetical protein
MPDHRVSGFDVRLAFQDNVALQNRERFRRSYFLREAMMNNRFKHFQKRNRLQIISSFVLLSVAFLSVACGHDYAPAKRMGQYEAGTKTQADLEALLKADARVDDFSTEGEKLIVNVNSAFTSQPYGMQQRTLGEWHNVWQAVNNGAKNATVIAQSSGDEIAKWTASEGYKPKVKAKESTTE